MTNEELEIAKTLNDELVITDSPEGPKKIRISNSRKNEEENEEDTCGKIVEVLVGSVQ